MDDQNNLDKLVDRITDAVRSKLLAQGVPLRGNAPIPKANGAFQDSPTQEPSQPEWKRMIQIGADRIGGQGSFEAHELGADQALAAKIDHTLLKPEVTNEELKKVCEEAKKYHFATVCVNPANIARTAALLEGSSVKPIAVVGFPLGASATATKAFETRQAVEAGAREIDMVVNIGALKARDLELVHNDIQKVVEAAAPYPVKVILETSSLSQNEKIIACTLSKVAGAAYVKTSTGFGKGGATAEDIALMREIVGPTMGVKASGGIRSYEDATKMIAAGATRIGASASVAIVTKKSPTQRRAKTYKSSLY